ncbi:hypothetical protein EV191_1011252 [Tamaricihabitans halophyticus]|uniref:Glyoxalase-like domain-containing protein n=1 Tax=Tamaricihabitans halophyticus TaxID=1262583 RepID=A0A4R2R655_9PSEU|nr:VOC family protein [Tamaricihabitans halophyticus]TCP57298.1 hypothetical protein EV191_1011252 [Tamaricihabitans halophyticus]
MPSSIAAIAVDCHDQDLLAAFWCSALGYQIVARWKDQYDRQYLEIGPEDLDGVEVEPKQPVMLFQPVPDDKRDKNRLHLDLRPPIGEQTVEVERLVALGARVVLADKQLPWVVLVDPEGNEFCVLPSRSPARPSTVEVDKD